MINIGFIGTGLMGLPMAENIFNVSSFSIDRLNAINLNPEFKIFLAIGRPIRPVPIKPMLIMLLM